MAEQNRVAVTLSPYQLKMLKMWAAINGRAPSTFAGQIISNRLESNAEMIRREFAAMAESEGVTPDDLLAKILGDND